MLISMPMEWVTVDPLSPGRMPIVGDFNPYAAPEAGVSPGHLAAEADEGRGVWRDEKTLVMAKVARLPSRCVKCNAPATSRLGRSLSWHTPWLYLMIFFPGLIFYVIAALIVRKTAKIEVPLCDEHRAARSKKILIGWVAALSGIALWFTPAFVPGDAAGIAVLVGVGLFLFSLFWALGLQVVTPQKIDKTHVWLNKVCPEYLAELPPLPFSGEEETAKGKATIDEV